MKKINLLYILTFFAFLTQYANAQSVAINSTGAQADTCAILDATSTNKGFLMPRMTAAQRAAIVNPATGLLVYQTDGVIGFYFYNGTVWTALNGAGTQGPTGPAPSGTGIVTVSNGTLQTPASLTGAVTTSGAGLTTTIANNAVTTNNIATGAVTIPKIGATGTASTNTFLRGDGAWTTINPNITVKYFIVSAGIYPTSGSGSGGTAFIGMIIPFAGVLTPLDCYECNGQLLNIADEPALYNLIGTKYGGDGINTFAVPNLSGATIKGSR